MQVVSPELVANKNVLLRLDLDVPIENGKVVDDFRLLAGMDTLGLCLEFAKSVTVLGHIGRPEGKEVPELSVKPIVNWLNEGYGHIQLPEGKLHILENLRFEPGEEACDESYAKEIISLSGADFYVNDAFASYHPAASTTILPTFLPHAAGLNFAEEVRNLNHVRNNPEKPLVVIMGGAKVEDKLPVIKVMADIAGAVLVGGKLVAEIREKNIEVPKNVLVGKLREDGLDLAEETVASWENIIAGAKMIVWNGPLGKTEGEGSASNAAGARVKGKDSLDSAKGTYDVAQLILKSNAKSIIGGGDTINALVSWDLLEKFTFVSTGGGAMLKLLSDGTLPTIEALK